jgi:predicted RNase H-like HicB family nuclease
MVKYPIIIEPTSNGYGGSVLDIPGLHAAADTAEEVRILLREILEERIEELRAEGKPVPPPRTLVDSVEIPN